MKVWDGAGIKLVTPGSTFRHIHISSARDFTELRGPVYLNVILNMEMHLFQLIAH